eukprot:2602786-Amphidinium_carterae.1
MEGKVPKLTRLRLMCIISHAPSALTMDDPGELQGGRWLKEWLPVEVTCTQTYRSVVLVVLLVHREVVFSDVASL